MNWIPMESVIRPAEGELILVRFKYRKNYTVYRYMGNEKWVWIGQRSTMSLAKMLIRYSHWSLIPDPED